VTNKGKGGAGVRNASRIGAGLTAMVG